MEMEDVMWYWEKQAQHNPGLNLAVSSFYFNSMGLKITDDSVLVFVDSDCCDDARRTSGVRDVAVGKGGATKLRADRT